MKNLLLVFFLIVNLSCSSPKRSHEYQEGAYLWYQTSGEFSALCYQAYNLAKMQLDQSLKEKHNRKRAVVFDIDETVLDNSFGGAFDIKNNIEWSESRFAEWVSERAATAIPGAREFINYAVSKQVEVIYVSNRKITQIEDTMANFEKLGIKAKKENLYFMTTDWSKEERRQMLANKYDIILFIGDSLGDFSNAWDSKSSSERRLIVDKNSQNYGVKFIVLPNPLYGEWENSLPKTEKRSDLLKTSL